MWLSNFTIILPDQVLENASLKIDGGLIAEIVPHPVAGGFDGTGLLALPGFIDMHGDMIEVEVEPRPGVDFPMANAIAHLDVRLASSGFTTAYAAISFCTNSFRGERRSREHSTAIINALRAARQQCRIDHRIHGRFDVDFPQADEVLAELIANAQIDLVSLMDHTPGQGQYRDLERHVRKIAMQKGVSIEEAHVLVSDRVEQAGPESERLGKLKRFAHRARKAGISLASHDDDSSRKVEIMAEFGAVISEFPTTIEAARAAAETGIFVAMGAPNAMRGISYSGNLSAREAHAAGLLHILASDYHPASALPAILALAQTDPDGLAGAVRLVSANPAQALGLEDRGALVPGRRADLALCQLGDTPRIVATLVAGQLAYSAGLVPH